MPPFDVEDVPGLATAGTLFARLRSACRPEWQAYIRHPFVRRLGDGTLPESAFCHYLGQDYLFLIHFARAYGLATYKATDLADIRDGAAGLGVILDEMNLHVDVCRRWGLTQADLEAAPEARATMAYTRYVLDRGLSGDLLDLHVALAPCVIGYAEIGLALKPLSAPDHPYREWIDTYASDAFVGAARQAVAVLDRLMSVRGGPGRLDSLIQTFRDATRLEADFWQMGLECTL